MGIFNRKKEEDEFWADTNDLLIVFDEGQKTSEVHRVSEIRDGAIYVTGKHKIPYEDCEITTGAEGRNFFYRAPSESVRETHRLAELERNMVLTQITAYKPPIPPATMDWTKGLLFGLIFVAFVVIGISSCGGGA
jgi:hypothetical protein